MDWVRTQLRKKKNLLFSHEQHLEMMLHVVFEQEVLQMMVVVRVRHVEKHYETDDDEKKNQVSVHGHVE